MCSDNFDIFLVPSDLVPSDLVLRGTVAALALPLLSMRAQYMHLTTFRYRGSFHDSFDSLPE